MGKCVTPLAGDLVLPDHIQVASQMGLLEINGDLCLGQIPQKTTPSRRPNQSALSARAALGDVAQRPNRPSKCGCNQGGGDHCRATIGPFLAMPSRMVRGVLLGRNHPAVHVSEFGRSNHSTQAPPAG